MEIIKDIVAGTTKTNYQIEIDRALAIYQVMANARKGDMILIAGKGHEKYQEIKGKKLPFSDADVVQQVLKDLSEKGRVQP